MIYPITFKASRHKISTMKAKTIAGGTYINFLTEDEGPERIKAALGKGLQRLSDVKAKWDPKNVFRTNRNILPA